MSPLHPALATFGAPLAMLGLHVHTLTYVMLRVICSCGPTPRYQIEVKSEFQEVRNFVRPFAEFRDLFDALTAMMVEELLPSSDVTALSSVKLSRRSLYPTASRTLHFVPCPRRALSVLLGHTCMPTKAGKRGWGGGGSGVCRARAQNNPAVQHRQGP